MQIDHEVPCREVRWCPRHGQLYIHIIRLLRDEWAVAEGGDSGGTDAKAILQIDWFGEVDGRNIVVVEEQVGSGGDGQERHRGEKEEQGGEVCFNGSARGQDLDRRDGRLLCAASDVSCS